MSSARSADRRKRPRSGFGTALVPLSRPPLFGQPAPSYRENACRTPLSCSFLWNFFWSAEIAARIVGVAVAPLLHQCLKLGIVPVGQDNPCGNEQVAGAACLRQPLPLKAESAA